jgi:uncharacterized membrane protein YgdD (TMEM256/DUF423 family)
MIGVSYVPAAWFAGAINGTMDMTIGGFGASGAGNQAFQGSLQMVEGGASLSATRTPGRGWISGKLSVGPSIAAEFTIFPSDEP